MAQWPTEVSIGGDLQSLLLGANLPPTTSGVTGVQLDPGLDRAANTIDAAARARAIGNSSAARWRGTSRPNTLTRNLASRVRSRHHSSKALCLSCSILGISSSLVSLTNIAYRAASLGSEPRSVNSIRSSTRR